MFWVAVGLAGRVPPRLVVLQFRLLLPSAFCVATPAHPGKRFSKYGTGATLLTSVPWPVDDWGLGTAANFDNIVAAWKYLVLLAGSFRLVGMAISTCIGKRRPMLPT